MAMLDSQPVFESRLIAAGLDPVLVGRLVTAGLKTLAQLAFLTSCQPGQGDDKDLMTELSKLLGYNDTDNVMPGPVASTLRRVWYEAYSVAIAEVKMRVERTDESGPKKLPLPERESRRLAQQAKLVGLCLTGHLEPSHSLIDAIFSMKEEEVLKYIDPVSCTNREQELQGTKKEAFVKLEPGGLLKAVTREVKVQADLSSEHRIRAALQRRSLSLDQLDLLDYMESEKYHDFLFSLLVLPVPSSHLSITSSDLLAIDKMVWQQMALTCRSGISRRPDGSLPLHTALKEALDHPMVRCMMQPLPRPHGGTQQAPWKQQEQQRDFPYQRQPSKGKSGGKGKSYGKGGKGKGGKSGKGRNMPPGLHGGHRNTSDGQAICFNFNLAGCPKAKSGGHCDKGLHVCCLCDSPDHTFASCPRKA